MTGTASRARPGVRSTPSPPRETAGTATPVLPNERTGVMAAQSRSTADRRRDRGAHAKLESASLPLLRTLHPRRDEGMLSFMARFTPVVRPRWLFALALTA